MNAIQVPIRMDSHSVFLPAMTAIGRGIAVDFSAVASFDGGGIFFD
jgi:hypothetical protein